MPDIFISYSREDQATASRFAGGLQREGFEVWWDQTLRSGEAYDEVTEKALKSARAVVVLWSRASAASRWVRAEATIADRKGTLVPAMIEPCDRPVMFELRQTAELAHWKGDADDRAWLAFVDDLRQKLGADAGTVARPVAGVARSRRAWARPAAAMGAVALLGVVGIAAWSLRSRGEGGSAAVPAPAAVAAPIKLAILPFNNLSADPEQAYWARGLAEDLATQLQQIGPSLRVLGAESTKPLEDRNHEPREIARLLGADYLLRGTVQSQGSGMRVTVSLMEGRDSAILWSPEPYQRQWQDVFALQQEIATDVARKVGIVLDITVPRALGGTINVAAFEKYLRGIEAWRGGNDATELFREAVKLDPEYMQAWFVLYIFQIIPAYAAPLDEVGEVLAEKAKAAAQLRKLPAESLLSRQFQALQAAEQRDWTAALSHAGAATRMSPVRDSVYGAANYHLMLGQISDAIPYLKLAREAEPLNLEVSAFLQAALLVLGQSDQARAEADRIKALGLETGPVRMIPPDRDAIKRAFASLPRGPDGRFATGLLFGELPSILQDDAALKQKLTSLLSESRAAGTGYSAAVALLVLGWPGEQAYGALRRALVDTPEGIFLLRLIWINGTAALMPREMLKPLVRDLGLVDYWRKNDKWSDFCHPVADADFECFDGPVTQAR